MGTVIQNDACHRFTLMGVGLAMPLRTSSRRALLDDPKYL